MDYIVLGFVISIILSVGLFIIYVVVDQIKMQCQEWTRDYYASHPEYNTNESVYEKCLNANGLTSNINQWENPFKIKTPSID